jgi:hypothetical protein
MDFSIPEFLDEEKSLLLFFVLTVGLGGGAAALSGRAVALTWRPWWQVVLYMLLLGLAVRFIHYALYQRQFLSLHYYLVETSVCLVLGLLSYRVTRVRQMALCYDWINERSGLLRWRRRAASINPAESG